MERRYQVFISSTYTDLVDARREVSDALLKCDCFPAGMELFPAADAEQFEFIKGVIDQSDYYMVISAGKYGSIHPQYRKSFAELEYDYAVEKRKPIIRLLHKDPFVMLAGNLIEATDAGRRSLAEFREKLTKSNLVSFWENSKELGQQVILGLIEARKRKPAIGWARADKIASAEAELSIERLKTRIAELESIVIAQSSELDIRKIFPRRSGSIDLVAYKFSRMFRLEDHGFHRDIGLNGRVFERTNREMRFGTDFYAERLLIGFLFTDDSDEVRKYAGAICEPETDIVHEVAMAEDEDSLEGIFMRLEQAEVIRRDRPRQLVDVIGNKSKYLGRSFWSMSEMAREFAVKRAVTGKYIHLSEVDYEYTLGR